MIESSSFTNRGYPWNDYINVSNLGPEIKGVYIRWTVVILKTLRMFTYSRGNDDNPTNAALSIVVILLSCNHLTKKHKFILVSNLHKNVCNHLRAAVEKISPFKFAF